MTKDELILSIMAVEHVNFLTSQQIEKLLFLLYKRPAATLLGPFSHFEPSHYDREICDRLLDLAKSGLIEMIGTDASDSHYRLTAKGLKCIKPVLRSWSYKEAWWQIPSVSTASDAAAPGSKSN